MQDNAEALADDISYTLKRKELLLAGLRLPELRGLEIGPLLSPVLNKSEANIFYIDHCDAEGLKAKYAGQIDVNLIKDVDFVWSRGSLQSVIGEQKFDYIIASHVIEHVPNCVGWLHELQQALLPNGILCLAIPDKRFTFDIARSPSTVGEFIQAYYEKNEVPSIKQIFDNYTLARAVDKRVLWRDVGASPTKYNYLHGRDVVWKMLEEIKNGKYVDCHCWIFTPESFLDIIEAFTKYSLLQLSIVAFTRTMRDQHEFLVQLQKFEHSDDSLQLALDRIQHWRLMNGE